MKSVNKPSSVLQLGSQADSSMNSVPQAANPQMSRRVALLSAPDSAESNIAPADVRDLGLGTRSLGQLRRRVRQLFVKLTNGNTSKATPIDPSQCFVQQRKAANAGVNFVLADATGPTLLTQAVASASSCAARAKAGDQREGPWRYFDAPLVEQLLHRETPKTEPFEELSAAPVERALDSILADEAICHMPAHVMAPIAELNRATANVFALLDPARRLVWTRALCDALKQDHPRPWTSKTPITSLLCAGASAVQAKACALEDFLRKPISGGFEALASVAILRAMYLAAERSGFASQTVPFISEANNFYIGNMLPLTGRIYVPWGPEKPKHQGVGLTAYHAPSPIDASWMQPGMVTTHLYRPNPNINVVLRDLAYGNPYGAGISGSTNVFLFAAGHFNAIGATHIDFMAMTTCLASVLCYDGGHSFNETYAAAQMYPEAAATSLAALSNYHPRQARNLFIRQVDPQGSWLTHAAFRRLSAFLLNPENIDQT